MPARGKHVVYTPQGTTVSGPNGAKTFVGKGPGPAGTKKVKERSYLEAPTVTTSPTGQVTTSGFSSPSKAQRAAARTRRTQTHVQTMVRRGAAQRKRSSAIAEKQFKATEKRVKAPKYKPTGVSAMPSIKAASKQSERDFASEGNKPPVQVKAHTRKAPVGFVPPVKTPAEQHPRAVKKVKRQLRKLRSGGKGPLRSPIVQTPEQAHVARTLIKEGQREGANRKEKLSALTAGLQESGMKNLPISGPGGGWRQEESAFYPPSSITNVRKGAKNFYAEAKSDTEGRRGRGETIPQLTQAIQASGAGESYYADNVGEAKSLLKQFNQGNKTPQQKKQLKRVEAKAKRLGVNPKAPNVGKPSKQVVSRYQAGFKAAKELAHSHVPYPTPDQHFGLQNQPSFLDCSAAVSWVLNKMGVLDTELVSGEMGKVLKPGPGLVTVFYNAGHTFMSFGNHFFGTSVNDSSKGLSFYKNPGSEYLSQYSVGHIAGLGKKEAIQLGFKLPSGNSFPGMTMSSSGTTATINSGAGTTQTTPGFSNSPIKLTPRQKYRRTKKALREVGIGTKPTQEEPSQTLKDLERKYQVA